MAKKDPKVRGKELADEMIANAKTPELKAALTLLASDPDALGMLGDKTLKQDEFSMLANEAAAEKKKAEELARTVQAHEDSLNEWHRGAYQDMVIGAEVRKAGGLEKLMATRGTTTGATGEEGDEGGAAPPAKTSAIDTSKFLTPEQLNARLAQERGQVAQEVRYLNSVTSKLAVEHYQKFGEVLDVEALYAHCDRVKMQLDRGGYSDFVKAKTAELAQKKHDEEIAEAEKRGAMKALEAHRRGEALPYVVGNGGAGAPVVAQEPSVIDILKARKEGKPASEARAGEYTDDVMAAAADYMTGAARAAIGISKTS